MIIVVGTLAATAAVYFSKPSWVLFLAFVILVPFIAWFTRRRTEARQSAEQIWRIALAAALTRHATISDLDALQITAGRMRRRRKSVTIASQINSGPARGRWAVTVPRSRPEVTLERQVSRGRIGTASVSLPTEPETDQIGAPKFDA